MKKIILFGMLLLAVNSFRVIDLCFKRETKCTGSFSSNNKYTVQCAIVDSCDAINFKFACGADYCSKDEASCKSLLYLIALMKSVKIKTSKSYENALLRLEGAIKSVRNCLVYSKYNLTQNDICINSDHCFIRKVNLIY
jgi:hypothetical protein